MDGLILKENDEFCDLLAQKIVNKLAPIINSQVDNSNKKSERNILYGLDNRIEGLRKNIMITDSKSCLNITSYINTQLYNFGCKTKRKKQAREIIKTNLYANLGVTKYESITEEKMNELEVAYGRPAKEIIFSIINDCLSQFKYNNPTMFDWN